MGRREAGVSMRVMSSVEIVTDRTDTDPGPLELKKIHCHLI